MKHTVTLGILLAALSVPALAETPAKNESQTTQTAAPASSPRDHMHNHMERMWKEMDSNGDGSISKEESAAFGNKKFDERDTNHDGKVTREEWDSFHNAKMEEMKAKHEGMKMDGAKPTAPTDKK